MLLTAEVIGNPYKGILQALGLDVVHTPLGHTHIGVD
jgi:hypothetical protein